MAGDPPACLTAAEHQAATARKDGLGFDGTKPDKRSTRRDDPTAARRSSSVKQATKCSAAENGCSPGTTLKDQFLLIGLPPPVVKADPNKKVQTADHNMQTQCSHVDTFPTDVQSLPAESPIPNRSFPLVLRVSQEGPSTSLDIKADVSSCPAGALVGSVTNQISTFHLTRDVESAPISPSSTVLSSLSETRDCLSGHAQVFGQECVMHVDGAEEDLQDELENVSSGDGKLLNTR
ncbi:unnamed protein product [Tetraodon nigroviridis]|uniref:(spotted green pufferfish) hypothetical protein n=1 Tax=Tetraodon nigroviridis TaxID=99883 RepID=Q4RTS9_TETNG|nr:unnamed protein product [Tetraodon nigroviridis]